MGRIEESRCTRMGLFCKEAIYDLLAN